MFHCFIDLYELRPTQMGHCFCLRDNIQREIIILN